MATKYELIPTTTRTENFVAGTVCASVKARRFFCLFSAMLLLLVALRLISSSPDDGVTVRFDGYSMMCTCVRPQEHTHARAHIHIHILPPNQHAEGYVLRAHKKSHMQRSPAMSDA